MNAKGFTLTEVLVTVALMGAAALAAVGMGELLAKASASGESSQSAQTLATTVRERLKHSDLCTSAMGPASGLNQGSIRRPNLLNGTQSVQVKIPGLQAGSANNDDVLKPGQIFNSYKLTATNVYFDNAVLSESPDTYVAQVMIALTTFSGRQLKPVIAGSVTLHLNGSPGNSSIVECIGTDSKVSSAACTSMGCEWDTSGPVPGCLCDSIHVLCPTGQFPTSISGNNVNCQSLGGSCPAGQYLTGVTLGGSLCASLPP